MADVWAPDDRAQLSADANDALATALSDDEAVRVVIRGQYNAAMIATDRRVLVFKKGWMAGATFRTKLESFDHDELDGIRVGHWLLSAGWVALEGPGLESEFTYSLRGPQPDNFANAMTINDEATVQYRAILIRELLSQAGESSDPQDFRSGADLGSANADAVELLRRLAELHQAGILTDEEFATKKSELLDRI